jgi:hypothetical protein
VQPIFSAIERIAAHCDVWLGAASSTNRTARSRTSGEYLLALLMTPSSQRLESPANPGRFNGVIEGIVAILAGLLLIAPVIDRSMSGSRFIAALTPFSAVIGVVAVVLGVLNILSVIGLVLIVAGLVLAADALSVKGAGHWRPSRTSR